MAHMHYKGTGRVHSFRGQLSDGEQGKIRIQGPVGAIAWRVTKFSIIQKSPGAAGSDNESLVQIWREEQSDPTVTTIDFDGNELLGVAYATNNPTSEQNPMNVRIIFDNALFSRNIWVTYADVRGVSDPCNYYMELEEVKVSAAGMAQLAVASARSARKV